jgi:hypothetical protein
VSHALELEKHADRHKTEVKRNQAVVDVKVQDELLRMKHTHEQEINKLLRENERLQKIIARYGGGHLSARVLSDEDTARSGTSMFGPGRTVSSTMADINRAPSPLTTMMMHLNRANGWPTNAVPVEISRVTTLGYCSYGKTVCSHVPGASCTQLWNGS